MDCSQHLPPPVLHTVGVKPLIARLLIRLSRSHYQAFPHTVVAERDGDGLALSPLQQVALRRATHLPSLGIRIVRVLASQAGAAQVQTLSAVQQPALPGLQGQEEPLWVAPAPSLKLIVIDRPISIKEHTDCCHSYLPA